jgi:hypothetical protein
VSSSDPPGTVRRTSAGPDAAEPAVPDGAHAGQAPADSAEGDAPAESAYDRARKLEQIKDLYLTAEAIGEANVDKHFDQLLAQQRELISDYFRQPGPAGSAAGAHPVGQAGSEDRPETDPRARRDPGPGGPATPPEGVGVAADQPRAW